MPDVSTSHEIRLGRQIRALRHRNGLTLVTLASMTNLSHPFLSQLERGLARPSMTSLERIANALGSSQSELMARAADEETDAAGPTFTLVKATEGTVVEAPGGTVRLLVRGHARFHPMVYEGRNPEFEQYYQHPEDEFVHVIDGVIEVDLGEPELVRLGPGDSLYYNGGTPHRWRTRSDVPYRLLAVKERPGPPGIHDDLRPAPGAEPC